MADDMSNREIRMREKIAETEAETRKNVAETEARSREDTANIQAGNVRGTGALTHYRPVGGWRTPGPGGEAGPGGGEKKGPTDEGWLGDPTSFRGGGGAPTPTAVMRGTQQTYTIAPPTPEGPGFVGQPGMGQEFSSPMRAGQEYNRGQGAAFRAGLQKQAEERRITDPTIEGQVAQRYGEFRPTGATLEDIKGQWLVKAHEAAGKNQYYEALARQSKAQEAELDLKRRREEEELASKQFKNLMSRYSDDFDKKSGTAAFVPKTREEFQDMNRAEQVTRTTRSGEAGVDAYHNLQAIRRQLANDEPKLSINDVEHRLDFLIQNPVAWQNALKQAAPYMVAPPKKSWFPSPFKSSYETPEEEGNAPYYRGQMLD